MNKELSKISELSSLLRWEISKLLKPEVENLIADYLDEIPRSHIGIAIRRNKATQGYYVYLVVSPHLHKVEDIGFQRSLVESVKSIAPTFILDRGMKVVNSIQVHVISAKEYPTVFNLLRYYDELKEIGIIHKDDTNYMTFIYDVTTVRGQQYRILNLFAGKEGI